MYQQDIILGLITTVKVRKQNGYHALASIGKLNLSDGCLPPYSGCNTNAVRFYHYLGRKIKINVTEAKAEINIFKIFLAILTILNIILSSTQCCEVSGF